MYKKILLIKILFAFTIIIGCKNKVREESQLYEISQLRTFDNSNKKSYDLEVYTKDKKDTILNQIKIYNFSTLDTLLSHFYEIEIKKKTNNIYEGRIKLFSILDTVSTKFENYKSMELSVLQEKGDSVFIEKYNVNENNEFIFQFVPFKDSVLTGSITEVLSIHNIPEDKEKMTLYLKNTFIDNNIFTINPFIESTRRANKMTMERKR